MAAIRKRASNLHVPTIIGMKRDEEELTSEEIQFVVDAISATPRRMEDSQIGKGLI